MSGRPKHDYPHEPDLSDPAVREVMTAFGVVKPESEPTEKTDVLSPTETSPVFDLGTKKDTEADRRRIEDIRQAELLSDELRHSSGSCEDSYLSDEEDVVSYRTPKRSPILGFFGFLGVVTGIGVAKVGKKIYQAPSSIFATLEEWGKGKMEKNWPFLKSVPFLGKWLLAPVEKSLSEEEAEAEKKKDPKKEAAEKKKKMEAEKKKMEKTGKEKNTAMVKEAKERAKAEGKTLTEKKKIRDGLDKQLEKAGIPEAERIGLLNEWDEMIKEEETNKAKEDEEIKKAA